VRIFVNDPKDLLRLGMPVTVTVERNTGTDESGGRGGSTKNASKPAGT
jgi:hypothetical protein